MEQKFLLSAKAKALGVEVDDLMQIAAEKIVASENHLEQEDVFAFIMELQPNDLPKS